MPNAIITSYEKDARLEGLVRKLHEHGYQLLSSRGTKKFIEDLGIPVVDVADYTGEPPRLDHRLVTIHPKVEGGFLARDSEEHRAELAEMEAEWFDLAYVNLYPVEQAINDPAATENSVIELTDVGGPLLMSAAAKGRRIILCDPNDIVPFVEWLESGCPDREGYLRELAAKADRVASIYRGLTASFHSDGRYHFVAGEKVADCGYGENRWQHGAALFSLGGNDPLGTAKFHFLSGSAPGFTNYLDLHWGLQVATHMAAGWERNFGRVPLIAVGCKHTNPCGAAVGEDPLAVLETLVEGDPLSIFGGAVIANFAIDHQEAEVLSRHRSKGKRPLDLVVAPFVSEEAIALLDRKDARCRTVVNPALASIGLDSIDRRPIFRYVRDGYLVQSNYDLVLDLTDPRIEVFGELDEGAKADILLGWAVGSMSHSNTITITKDGRVLANGVAQQDRVGCVELALHRAIRAENDTAGAVAYSDSFFPFDDGPRKLAEAGVKTIFTSSGSKNDKDTVQVCQELGITLLMAPDEYFRGFRH